MKKAHFIYTEGITRYAPKGKSFIQGSISFEEPLTLEEFDKFNKSMYISNEDLQAKIDKAMELLEQQNSYCPSSLTLEKSYIIEVEKINKVLNILKGSDSND